MIKKFLHVGIGRCSNITLINHIYPVIAKNSNFKFYTSDEHIQNQIDLNYEKMKLGLDINKNININENLIVSDERLVGWNPFNWVKYADSNLKMFGYETTVLIVLRDPFDYLNSIYKNQCLVNGNLMTAEEYFALNKTYRVDDKQIFNLELFSYSRLKKIYEERFRDVIFLDYNQIKKMNFFQEYFNLNNEVKEELIDLYINSKPNKSFNSEIANNLTLKLYSILKKISLIFNLNVVKKKFKHLKILSNKKKIKNNLMLELSIMQIDRMNQNDIKFNFYRSFINMIKWQNLMFLIEDIFCPKKKYKIQLSEIKKNIIIEKCRKEYLNIISK